MGGGGGGGGGEEGMEGNGGTSPVPARVHCLFCLIVMVNVCFTSFLFFLPTDSYANGL